MAAEYGALLKWPKELEKDLGDLMGKPATLVLQLELSGMDTETHTILIDGKADKASYYDEIYKKCFVHIKPVKTKLLKGSILSFVAR